MEQTEGKKSKRKRLAGLKPGAYIVDGALARLAIRRLLQGRATTDYFRSSLA